MKTENILTMTQERKDQLTKGGQELAHPYHVSNAYRYLAFEILHDAESFGLNCKFINHDGTLDERIITPLANFLEENEIILLSDVFMNREKIAHFLEDKFFGGRGGF